MFIGKLSITSVIVICSYYIVVTMKDYINLISNPLIPTIICGIIGYSIGSLYMSIFGLSSNAIIQCFLIDETINIKKGQRAIYCPGPLR